MQRYCSLMPGLFSITKKQLNFGSLITELPANMFRLLLYPLFCLSIVFGGNLTTADQNGIVGFWNTDNDEALVQVFQKEELYFGKVITLARPLDSKGNPKKDRHNKEPALRDRPLVGIHTLYDLKFDQAEQSWKGKVYIPSVGFSANVVITLKDKNTMYVRGYLGRLTKTQVWKRVR